MAYKIIRMDHQGRGITYVDGKITFVNKTIPEDEVDIRIINSKSKYNKAEVTKYINKSNNRVKEECSFYNICGGCDLQNFCYEDSLEYKKNKVIDIFRQKDIKINPIVISNPEPYYYRNKIELKIVNKIIGYYEKKTNKIVEIDSCVIASKVINKVIKELSNFNIINGDVIIRCNTNEEVLIIINTKDEINIDIDCLKNKFKLVGIILNNNLIYGESHLFERINGNLFKISYDAFFQVNPYVASLLFDIIKDNINEDDIVLDLYCGVGVLSIVAAKKAREVIGIEIIPNAIKDALINTRINNVNNTNFVLNDVDKAVDKINKSIDTLILDPPRKGITENVIKLINRKLPKKIIYVACDSFSLARDVKLLNDKYEVSRTYVLDMFSYTYHVETICILHRKTLEK